MIESLRPDLIHIHGSEGPYGLLTERYAPACPVVISMQGLLGPSSTFHHFFGDHSLGTIVRMHRILEIPAMRGLLRGFMDIRKKARRERDIIRTNRFFIGRTRWDRAYIRAIHPEARYFHGGEILRDAFYQNLWQLNRVQRHRIIFTNAGHPRKGTDLLLDALELLRSDYPDMEVCIAGPVSRRSGYGTFIRRKMAALGSAVRELGQLDSQAMVQAMLTSHVFVSPSYIDNSPNAVCEAQSLGMPVVASYTGGVPSLIDDGRTGLFYPKGDMPMLAQMIRNVFDDDTMAERLGQGARQSALVRHDPDTVVQDILDAYHQILECRS
ncbi:glycosyltransferase family 4 protein [Desulfatiferula olefinivorans]